MIDSAKRGADAPRYNGRTRIDELAAILRCNYGQKGMRVFISTDYRVPAGVPAMEFLNADDCKRKRMIRQARG